MLRKFVLLFLLLLSPVAFAAGNQLSQYEYKQLSGAFKLMEEGSLTQARKLLKQAQPNMKSDYAKALVFQNLAQIALHSEQFSVALKNLKQAKVLNALPKDQQDNLDHTLGQLYCMQESWSSCIKHLKQWMAAVPGSVKPSDHLLVAQAYSQLESWKLVLPHISKAINAKKIAPQNWYQLKVVAHVRLKQWSQAAKQQQVLLRHYSDKPGEWRQLVSLQLQAKQRKSALATQRLGYNRKILRKPTDYTLLAQLLMNQNIPYQAGIVLQEGMKAKVVKASVRNLRILSQAWIVAKEMDKAIGILKRLNQIAPNEKTAAQLAQIQIQERKWKGAEATLVKALKKSVEPAELQLMLGITRLNMKKYDAARSAFDQAGKSSKYEKTVAGWIRYLDQMNAVNELRG
ncbi:hypothetical protein [Neptuniibacter sp.]|uniref:hypothetical protein n=1 Tax=Neptuniibacter sp. TaxID=1962643 RepID=UPI00260D4223|nr:hypothetical protein [Neptuniibacter sp.]MCP4595287.1 hypothetical protein [Neptuniibacter sp.]